MKMIDAFFQQRQLRPRLQLWCAITALALTAGPLVAQSPAVRISAEINSSEQSVLPGSKHPLALAQLDAGRVPADTRLTGVTISFSRSAAQEANLQTLLKAQQTPGSPQFHQWLTPDQFAARFGVADADIEKVQSWLERQGFAVDSISRSRNAIHFSGTAGSVEQTFATEMHYYNLAGVKHMAPSTALSIPTAVAPLVSGVLGLNDFKPRSMLVHRKLLAKPARPLYTVVDSNGDEDVFFTPGDIKVAYDINPLIGAGNNGTGQTIAIMGQSAIQNSDIENFQQAAGLTVKDPTMTLVPGTGASAINADGDEGESDLDVEYSGATAPGATINFVYTGASSNLGVFASYQYAVDQNIGNIISISYGSCEPELTQTDFTTFESWGAQAMSQGQTVIASSGDSGATGCYGFTDLPTATQNGVAVNYPASSAYVTAVGGTEITAANDQVGMYWSSASSASNGIVLTSALSYIPEVAWNDDVINTNSSDNPNCAASFSCVSASGGGISTLTAQPSWQTAYFTKTGEANPSSKFRLVPDVALYSSPNYPGYLFCSSDPTDWGQQQGASCGNGQFYDSLTFFFTIAGGTSFAAPIFAGEMAILNQANGYTTGQGLANTQLYMLAANSATYATAFHDITTGTNECTESPCPGSGGYSAGTGYDMVTGLGSLDLKNLVTAWPSSTSTLIGTTTTITPSNAAPVVNTSDTFTITVSAASGTTVPTGSVSVSIDGGTATSYPLTTSGSAATASFNNTFTTTGVHTITASFPATTTFGASTGSVTVNVQANSSGSGAIAVSATPSTLTVSQGSQGSETILVTPSGGYTGTVILGVDFGSSDNTLANLCGGFTSANSSGNGEVMIGNSSAASTQLVLDTNASDCLTADAVKRTGMHQLRELMGKRIAAKSEPRSLLPEGIAFAGLLAIGFIGRRSRKLRGLVAVLLLATVGMALSACGSTNGNTVSNPPKGTYTTTIQAEDSATATITATTTFSFVID
ncbi:protease pro-enzyme activation domain-containing protein [Terracidiphilus gabretensis]|uniref:protease pro-enzyme activation domain-containing protein n=1 Tax=Terracidiphilus gabretensis TaxID=1577687 RepID=UPI00071B5E61|nr:protease pro-enzyme activation domain-containing protein [Terracidiphilus gabretensis]